MGIVQVNESVYLSTSAVLGCILVKTGDKWKVRILASNGTSYDSHSLDSEKEAHGLIKSWLEPEEKKEVVVKKVVGNGTK